MHTKGDFIQMSLLFFINIINFFCSETADYDSSKDWAHPKVDHHRVHESSLDQCKHAS